MNMKGSNRYCEGAGNPEFLYVASGMGFSDVPTSGKIVWWFLPQRVKWLYDLEFHLRNMKMCLRKVHSRAFSIGLDRWLRG